MAPRLAETGRAKFKILKTNETATIVMPGRLGKKITLRLDKSGKPIERLPKEIAILNPPQPAAPLTLGQICGLCFEEAASKKCSGCGTGVCSQECYLEKWKEHKPSCLEEQSGRAGEEYAREGNRAMQLLQAAVIDDVSKIQKLTDRLLADVAKAKFKKFARVAVRRFVNFIDPRDPWPAIYGAAQESSCKAVRLLHDVRADLDARTAESSGSVAAHIAAARGHTAMVRLLHELRADVQCRRLEDGELPIHASAVQGHSAFRHDGTLAGAESRSQRAGQRRSHAAMGCV